MSVWPTARTSYALRRRTATDEITTTPGSSATLPIHAHSGRPTLALQSGAGSVARTVHTRERARAREKSAVARRAAASRA